MNLKDRTNYEEIIAQIQQARHQTAIAWGTQKITWEEMVDELDRLEFEEEITERAYTRFLAANRIIETSESFNLGNSTN